MDSLIHLFTNMQSSLIKFPIVIYVFIGSFVEELVAPIPSPIVLTTAGSLVDLQHKGFLYLFLVALFAVTGKMLATLIYYFAAFKGEELLNKRFFKLLGLGALNVDKYGKLIENTKQGELFFVLLRVIPIFPAAPVSFLAGLIGMTFKKFAILTAIGLYIRSMILLVAGFYFYEQLDGVLELLIHWESNITYIIALVIVIIGLLYTYKNKDKFETLLLSKLKKKTKN